MNLCPGLNKPLLRLGQASAEALDRVNREDRCLILVVRVEMCAVMLTACLDEHPDHDPEEPGEFRHIRTLGAVQK